MPDRFLVGLATLSLLSEAAQERPLLCVIDDAQWLDRASAQVLAFVARRLLAESVVLLVATREASRTYGRLPELVVEGLRDADARALLASAIPGRLDERVADQLLAEARGQPAGVAGAAAGIVAGAAGGRLRVAGSAVAVGQIEESFSIGSRRCLRTRSELLLVAAAEPTGDPALLWRAAERLGIADAGARAGGVGGPARSRRAGFAFAIRSCARPSTERRRRRPAATGAPGAWPRRPTRRPIPTGARGIWPRRPPARTRTSPPSSSGPPAGRRRGAVWPPPPRSSSAPPR